MASSQRPAKGYYGDDPLDEMFAASLDRVQAERDSIANDRYEPLTQYRQDPLGYIVTELGVARETLVWSESDPLYQHHIWDGTPDPLVAMMSALRDGQNVSVEASTGTQKSFSAACLALWFLASWESRVGTYAPREAQLTKAMWMEMGKLFPAFKRKFPRAEMHMLALYVDATQDAEARQSWSAVGIPVQIKAGEVNATSVQGLHAPHVFQIIEETPGMAQAAINSIEATATGDHQLILALGNPNHRMDTLHQLAMRPSWRAIRISSLDHPNVVLNRELVPGACTRASVKRMAEKYGVTTPRDPNAHVMYKSRVRGIVPDQVASALFRSEWIDRAVEKQKAWVRAAGSLDQAIDEAILRRWPQALGIDPSQSDDGDFAGEARMLGPYTLAVKAAPCPNATDLGTQVWVRARAQKIPMDCIGVDPIGLGAATVNELRRQMANNNVFHEFLPDLVGGGKPIKRIARLGEVSDQFEYDVNLFENLRAQMYWQAMLDLQNGHVGLPEDPELHTELLVIQWEPKGPKVIIMDKKKIREALGGSPNKADAWVYCNWVRKRQLPVEAPVKIPDLHDYGVKQVGGKMVPMTREDVDTAGLPALAKGPPLESRISKWW